MKVKIDKDTLIKGIQIVQNVVSTKATLPILSNMLVETKRNLIRLNTTDLDIGISCELPVETLEEGAITIPAKRFSDIAKELPSGEILIYAKKNQQIDIEGQKCRFKLIGLPKEEFPKFPEFKNKEAIIIKQKDLKEMIRLTSFAVSHEESRYVLNGILMDVKENTVCMVATDGRRLAKIEKQLQASSKTEVSVIIPLKAIQEIYRNLGDEGQVSIVCGTNQVLFDIEGVLVATRIIEGEFPNYKQVIPEAAPQKIKVNTQKLLSAIRRANLLATPDFQAIKCEVFSNKLVVSKSTPNVGESREEVAMEYNGKELIVGFNPQFLIDVLKNVEQEDINLELLGPDKAGVIRMSDYLYLVLPMRI
ncbi:MAG TPA: DNA polymerase III subunit beta [Candidatus Omnitrophota bacterium]|jgi:DNA polymerase-3 subunit beta|nr:DNA polymerase III subunit beta [Candidatus Omnitrophota bacterium]HSA30358.1 DNA polymerase III subunit beta [Candidatus Omnitrophota bacterium]